MRRTDRLFDLIQLLRDGKLHRAEDLARVLEVSVRTLYRDMATLQASGVPVEGERGVGYMITAQITLPPLNLTMAELEALHLGLAVVGEAADPDLQRAAETLSSKIDAVLPEDRRDAAQHWGFAVQPFATAQAAFRHMPAIRAAIRASQKLDLEYCALDGTPSHRVVRPLELEYWGRFWTLTAWCEWRDDFRVFRVDRIQSVTPLPALFIDEPGKTLEEFLKTQTGTSAR